MNRANTKIYGAKLNTKQILEIKSWVLMKSFGTILGDKLGGGLSIHNFNWVEYFIFGMIEWNL